MPNITATIVKTKNITASINKAKNINVTIQKIAGVGGGGSGTGAVDSVNGQTGVVTLNQDNIGDGTTYKQYSNTEKTKLAGIQAGAEVNVNADWNSVSGDSQILNKPTIPTVITDHTGLTSIGTNTHSQIDTHISSTNNPHSVTKTQVGLANVDNTSDLNKPISTATQTALDLKVDENIAITGATKTKITYDSKGLVTAGADATTNDIADSLNKRYVTDTQLTVLSNTSGTNTGDQDISNFETTTQLNTRDTNNRNRTNHTGTQTATTISDFQSTVSSNTDVTANTSARHSAVTVTDSSEIDFTLTGQNITASLIAGSIDETKLDTSVNASLDLADSSLQSSAIGTTIQGYSSVLANTTASFTTADETKLDGIEAGAEVNNINDTNATDLTDGGDTALHIHDSRYYTETEVNSLLSGKQNTITNSDSITEGITNLFLTTAERTKLTNTSGTNTGDNATNTQYSGLATSKQDTLISGTNIKTINSTSLLGSGDVAVEPTITAGTTGQYYRGDKTFQTLDKTAVGLGNVDNTSDSTKNSATATLTNKRITKRVGTTTSSATPTINTDNVDFYSLTALAVNITSFTTNLSGTPTDGQTLWVAITGTATRTIAWGTSFESSTVTLPTTTVNTDRLDVGFVWNTATSKWRCVAKS